MSRYIPGAGNQSAKLMVVGEAPGRHEDEEGAPFVGPSGLLLNEMLSEAGIDRSEVYTTNVFKYRPPDNDLRRAGETGHTIDECVPQLWSEIDTIKPNAILALGGLALSTLTGKTKITEWRGSILQSLHGYPKVVSTFHPANLLNQRRQKEGAFTYSARYYMQLDMNRAVEQSKFRDFRLPKRKLEVARNASDVFSFLQMYRGKKKVAVDIEVIKSIPICIGLAFNKNHAMCIPFMDISAFPGSLNIPMHQRVLMYKMIAKFLETPDLQIIGSNFKFDQGKIRRPLGIRIPYPWFDTQLAAHVAHCEFPKSMAFLQSIYTEEPYHKGEGKEFNPKKDRMENYYLYNAKDCCVAFELHEEILKVLEESGHADFFFNFQMPLHQAYMEIEEVGFHVNEERRKELWKKYSDLEKGMQNQLDDIAGYHVRNLAKKEVSLLLFDRLGMPQRDSTDEDTLVALMCNHGKNEKGAKACNLIINLRRVKKTKSTYLKPNTDFDGVLRWNYRIDGAETGRTSTSVLEPPVRPIKSGLAMHNMTKHGEYGGDIRSMLVPAKGMIFGEADESQAEARVVALLAKDEEMLNMFGKTDIHKLTASWCFGIPIERVTKEQRFIGKTTRHAGNYGMQKKTLMQNIQTDARKFHIDIPPISEWKAGEILKEFHRKNPKIQNVFHQEVKDALANNARTIINPFGRPRTFFGRDDDALYREAYAQIPQSTVSDQLKAAMVRIKKRLPWLQILVEAHDAIIWQCYPEQFAEVAGVVKEEMEKPIDFSRCTIPRGSLIIPCDVKIGETNYKDLVDYKVA